MILVMLAGLRRSLAFCSKITFPVELSRSTALGASIAAGSAHTLIPFHQNTCILMLNSKIPVQIYFLIFCIKKPHSPILF
jgi:hypothetical protein